MPQNQLTSNQRAYRIRRCSGFAGGSNFYHHADVIASSWSAALRAAREGRVQNWRRIDCFDTSDETYVEFEYLYPVKPGSRVFAAVPIAHVPSNWNPPPKRSFESYLANRKRLGALRA